MRELLNTLYVQTQGTYLRLQGETVVAELERVEKLKMPLHHLGALVVFGNVMTSVGRDRLLDRADFLQERIASGLGGGRC